MPIFERPPILLVVVDTEEECDWSAGFRRDLTSVTAMRKIARVQKVFEEFRIRPTYVVDYPVASQKDGISPLKEIFDDGWADLGAHLHPWV
ncbi:MAG: WalW protein, partial [Gammaproteobacteria bacterium]